MADRSQEEIVSDLIQKSELIREGNPARYRLLTTRSNLDESGMIRKWTFGQREINTQNKIILLVGETGTGKTTLINAIVNHTLRVKFEDHVWFEITEDSQAGSQSEDQTKPQSEDQTKPQSEDQTEPQSEDQTEPQSEDQTKTQTTEITVYEVFGHNNQTSVTMVDTPGYGDTRGLKHDKMIADNLRKLFENDTGVKEIDAMCLVVKASQNRLSDSQRYIFDAVLSLFGKDIKENIVISVTHSNGMPPKNVISVIKKLKIPCRKTNGNYPVYFLFDNCQAEERTTEYEEVYRRAWELTEKTLKKFFPSLEDQKRKSLEMTEKVLKEQIQLKECVSNLRQHIELKEHKHKELTQIQEALKQNQEKIQKNVNFSFKVTKSYKEKQITTDKVTSCSVCEENCHEYKCWCAINPSWCEVMKDRLCTVCTGKCHDSKHIKENMKYVIKSEEVTMTFTDLKNQYETIKDSADKISLDSEKFEDVRKENESNMNESQENISIENKLKEELKKIEEEKAKLELKANNIIKKLSEIALKPDSAFIESAKSCCASLHSSTELK